MQGSGSYFILIALNTQNKFLNDEITNLKLDNFRCRVEMSDPGKRRGRGGSDRDGDRRRSR